MTNEWLLQMELFWQAGLAGGLLAVLLPILGLTLRLRHEYWAALAYGQLGAAGALGALVLGLPLLLGGLVFSLAAAAAKHPLERRLPGVVLYPLLFILGWGTSHLMTANLPGVERQGMALFEGQLYFAGTEILAGSILALTLTVIFIRMKGKALLLAHLFPAHFGAQGHNPWRVRAGFDLLVAASLALAVMSLGVMGAFALILIPAWIAGVFSSSWRTALIAGPLLSLLAYVLAFMLALIHDQPFGPVLVLVLGLMALALPAFSLAKSRAALRIPKKTTNELPEE